MMGEPLKVRPVVPPDAATDVTVPVPPVAAMVIEPAPLVMLTPEPAVSVVRVKPLPLPMSSAPLAGVLVRPVPPLATARVPASVRVPLVVIGEPLKVRPVVPPEAATLVTVPVPPPLAAIVIAPDALVIVILLPAVKFADV